MTKSEYIFRFSRAAGWLLSYQEAQEAIDDYGSLFLQSGKDDAEVCRELGNPVTAARLLSSPAAYRRWLAVFCVQALSLAVPFFLLLSYYPFPSILPYPVDARPLSVLALAAAGLLASLVWFRPKREFRDGKIPGSIFFVLGFLLFAAGAAAGLTGYFLHLLYRTGISLQAARLLAALLTGTGVLSAIAGILAVIKSRVRDRRWRAVYILALTVLLICTFFLQLLVSLDFTPSDGGSLTSIQLFLTKEFKIYALLGAVGILSAGGSLC